MKAAVTNNLPERIIDQPGFVRKSASECAVMSGRDRIEEVPELRNNLDKVTIHDEDVPAGSGSATVAQRPTDSGRRLTIQKLNSGISLRQSSNSVGCAVRAVIVHENDFAQVLAVHLEECIDQLPNIHLLSVTRDDNRG